VVMTAASSDGPMLAKHHTTKKQRKSLALRMKDDGDPLKLVIVRDMWLDEAATRSKSPRHCVG